MQTSTQVHKLGHVQHMDVQDRPATQVAAWRPEGNAELQGFSFGFDIGEDILVEDEQVVSMKLIKLRVPRGPMSRGAFQSGAVKAL